MSYCNLAVVMGVVLLVSPTKLVIGSNPKSP
jgi:hypothetical protein